MAENKKSIILYCDLIHTLESLEDIEVGKLFKHLFRYVNDQSPEAPDRLTQLIFEPIKQQLKRDLREWDESKKAKSEGGKKSAEVRRKLKEIEHSLSILNKNEDTSSNSTVNVTVNDTVNVNANVSVIKTPLLEIFFTDLPSSTHFENISRSLNIPKETLTLKIPQFRKAAKVEYPNFIEFCNHFKNWVKKMPADQPTKKRNHIDI